ncbi:MAG: dihydroorotate dehydrogenase [Candidatus Omnitrophica bacterium]|nr:dihydroorotate dehydrogenase [Candidatus Omnitrophota bacterium]
MPSLIDLRVPVGSLTLKNPILVAAGTFGYGTEFSEAIQLDRLGALVTKTLTRQPRSGHPPPRLVETPSGLLNAVGLQNVGLDAFLREKLPALRRFDVPVIVSVLGDSAEELSEMTRRLNAAAGVAAIEVNLSCPNLRDGSRVEGQGSKEEPPASLHPAPVPLHPRMVAQDADATFAMIQAARQHTRKPVIAKLSPDVTDLAPIAQAAERAGASAVTIGNTFTGMSLDVATRRSRLGTMTGGLSGPAIRPLAVYRVWYTAASLRLPIIGAGGVVRADDALEFFLAGASAVAIGTANFADPRAPLRVLRGIERYLRAHRMRSLQDLRTASQTS